MHAHNSATDSIHLGSQTATWSPPSGLLIDSQYVREHFVNTERPSRGVIVPTVVPTLTEELGLYCLLKLVGSCTVLADVALGNPSSAPGTLPANHRVIPGMSLPAGLIPASSEPGLPELGHGKFCKVNVQNLFRNPSRDALT